MQEGRVTRLKEDPQNEQQEGMYYEITLRQPLILSAVFLDTGGKFYTFLPVTVKHIQFTLGTFN